MKRLLFNFFSQILCFLFLFSFNSHASYLSPKTQTAFRALARYKKLPSKRAKRKSIIERHKGEYMGVLCEVFAAQESKKKKPHHKILKNVKYRTNSKYKKQEGELDIVIINPETGFVEAIKEVKCCWNIHKASVLGRNQLKRFNNLINERKQHLEDTVEMPALIFTLEKETKKTIELTTQSFSNNPELLTVTYNYGEAEQAGFDEMIEEDYEELEQILEMFAEFKEDLETQLE